jgi:hypothetical protein
MAPLMSIAAELRQFIRTSIPQIIDHLKDDKYGVRFLSVVALSTLSEHGM